MITIRRLTAEEILAAGERTPEWEVCNEHHLRRRFRFPDFASALAFVNRVSRLAEEKQHHPEIVLSWGRVEITLWTHAVDGLTTWDFELAAAIDSLYEPRA